MKSKNKEIYIGIFAIAIVLSMAPSIMFVQDNATDTINNWNQLGFTAVKSSVCMGIGIVGLLVLMTLIPSFLVFCFTLADRIFYWTNGTKRK